MRSQTFNPGGTNYEQQHENLKIILVRIKILSLLTENQSKSRSGS